MKRRSERILQQLGGVQCGGLTLANPFMTASGTSGHDVELGSYMPLDRLGAVVVKSLFHEPWEGNPAPRVHLAQGGMINAVGLQVLVLLHGYTNRYQRWRQPMSQQLPASGDAHCMSMFLQQINCAQLVKVFLRLK